MVSPPTRWCCCWRPTRARAPPGGGAAGPVRAEPAARAPGRAAAAAAPAVPPPADLRAARAGAVTVALGEPVDASVIFGVVLVNAVVGFIQESRAEAALDALRPMVRTRPGSCATGTRAQVPSENLVPGDLVLLEAGDKVPADLRLVRRCRAAGGRVGADRRVGARWSRTRWCCRRRPRWPTGANMAYSGTLVTSRDGDGRRGRDRRRDRARRDPPAGGRGRGAGDAADPQARRFSQVLTVGILALAAVTFAVGLRPGRAGRRDVHGGRRAGRRGHPGGAAGGGHDHAGYRGGADGAAAGRRPAAARGGDAGQHDRRSARTRPAP